MEKQEFVLFYNGPFSQWKKAEIDVDGILYNCCEQYMMAQKALLFRDFTTYQEIMDTSSPEKQKALGRKVKDFKKDKWERIAKDVVFQGNWAKFTQHPDLMKILWKTGDKIIVEASPTDTIWGIGLGEHDPDAKNPKKWKGTNWLGEVLMEVRKKLQKEGWFDNFEDE